MTQKRIARLLKQRRRELDKIIHYLRTVRQTPEKDLAKEIVGLIYKKNPHQITVDLIEIEKKLLKARYSGSVISGKKMKE